MAGTKSFLAKNGQLPRNWWLIDANKAVVGRLATEIATILMGKHLPTYTPHVDTGDFVVVINVEKVRFTGRKMEQKTYTWFSGYTGLKTETAGHRIERAPELILKEAVRRMLPKSRLGVDMLDKLKLYRGDQHPHQAQNPQPRQLEGVGS